jgi:chromosome transmission fidelity protein 18
MNSDYLELDSFDPAIYIHSEVDHSYSDDIAALEVQKREIIEEKTRNKVVIQHRRWKLSEVFQSEDDLPQSTPSPLDNHVYPSSPPIMAVETTSTANPTIEDANSARKRRKLEDVERSPLKDVSGNSRKYGFFESESEDEADEPQYIHKTSTVHKLDEPQLEPLLTVQTVTEPTEPSFTDAQSVEILQAPIETLSATSSPPMLSMVQVQTMAGRTHYVGERMKTKAVSYERTIASRSVAVEGKATKSYYGIDIHSLMQDLSDEQAIQDAEIKDTVVEPQIVESTEKPGKGKHFTKLWTERYRAQKFTDLVGDERTHRTVLHWLKRWDQIVFPGSRPKRSGKHNRDGQEEESIHRKVLILAGPPGLGKTTLAHVCAKQAGYEVHEINGSDDRTAKVVKERIRDMLATENVRGVMTTSTNGKVVRKAGKPQCVVVDEVDGVLGGSGQEAGFIKALIDLVQLDQKNTSFVSSSLSATKKTNKKERFRMLRPLVLVCNDIYHPSLRALRQSGLAEIIHMRRPPINTVISRLHSIFDREGVKSDEDAIRRLCESVWGVSNKKDARQNSGTAAGDIRSVLVVGEWVASKFRSHFHSASDARLTRAWFEEHILKELGHGGSAVRNLGRGNTRDVVERVFQEDVGFLKGESSLFSKSSGQATGVIGVTEAARRKAIERLNEMIWASGETDRILTGNVVLILLN